MSTTDHLLESYGLPVFDFPRPGGSGRSRRSGRKSDAAAELPAVDAVAWRISADTYDAEESWPEAFARFAAAVDITRVRGIVVGSWKEAYADGPQPVIDTLLDARAKLTALRALFLGDMVSEECEISWINQGDVTPLLAGFPELEEFGVRGGTGLSLQPVTHQRLRSLIVETGGLPADVVRAIAASDLPSLEELELWLGTSEYGADSEISDLAPLLAGTRLPSLRHLALCNSEIQDEIAAAVAAAPVVAQLETLDLSMGVLTDEGATALLGGQPLTHLKELDLHHNYLSDPLRERLREVLESAGVILDVDPGYAEEDQDQDEDEDGEVWRFVAVGE